MSICTNLQCYSRKPKKDLEELKIPWKLNFNIKDKQIFGKSLRKNTVCNGSGKVSKALELCFGENVLLHNNFYAF